MRLAGDAQADDRAERRRLKAGALQQQRRVFRRAAKQAYRQLIDRPAEIGVDDDASACGRVAFVRSGIDFGDRCNISARA